ncbi:hypothetical protein FPOAC1_012501 [Fusarium poae]|uniref:hypothetical protein n=1 Tax=Fusarium poae TaxID=36050 RepID=UPI001CE85C5C|nr:hypothetical protein FPOAC1_012501 [Fusarium poae]KAG8667668.1 hypothetical protein FPOAC1_012501 [Fusarium poae]
MNDTRGIPRLRRSARVLGKRPRTDFEDDGIPAPSSPSKSHNGPCGKLEEEDLQSVLELAERTGWKRCGKCGHLIEKSVGCNHMICLCGNDFCYNCGKNTIIAAQMAEDTGEEMDDEMIEEMMAEEVMVDLVAERMDERDWDERPCNHRWNRLLEPSNCQECGKTVQGYNIFVCRACELVACLACRQEH